MAHYFETVKSFADVPITDVGVDTASFLEASDGLVQLFDLLGSGVFGFVQSDIRSNIAGVRQRYQRAPLASNTLQNLVRHENADGSREGTACLVRLVRGLTFTCRGLQQMQENPAIELHVCFRRSYNEVLSHHHTFIIRSLAAIAVRAVPHRDDFLARIAQGGSVEKLNEELAKWLAGLDVIVKSMKTFLEEGGYGRI